MSNKLQTSEKIKLAEEDDTLTKDDVEVAVKVIDFFSNAVIKFLLKCCILKFRSLRIVILCQLLLSIVKYKKHLTIITIASEFIKKCFSFNAITIDDALKEISMLYSSKAIHASDITVKVTKGKSNFFVEQLCAYLTKSVGKWKSLIFLKLANIKPVFKKGVRTSKNNYRPVCILPAFSKKFDIFLQKELLVFVYKILLKFQ